MRFIIKSILLLMFGILLVISTAQAKKVLILGIDGLDPNLLDRYMAAGVLPNFSNIIANGSYSKLETTMAPQSPVAWSTFITGMDPGGHGIYDFIHRDPKTMMPYSAMSKAVPAKHTFSYGSWVIPLSRGKVKLLRKGRAFWQLLGEHGVPTTVFRMPVNFPPVEAPLNKSISGMGTPDIIGSPGTFTFYTEKLPKNHRDFHGGIAKKVKIVDDRIDAKLYGPKNPFRKFPIKTSGISSSSNKGNVKNQHPEITLDFTVYIDYKSKAAKFVVDNKEFILMEKEWSDWIAINFKPIPYMVTIHSIGRFYLKQLKPNFELYVSPLQISPANPALPISFPPKYCEEVCSCIGYFYTQELPEDSKALTYGVFSGQDFWDQAMIVYEERVRALKYLLNNFDDGLLFLYFMTVDQGSHMLWRYMDKNHPCFIKDDFLINGIQRIYQKMDDVIGYVLDNIDDDTVLIIMSDHGFNPFHWQVNLNSWLVEKGYVTLKSPEKQGEFNFFLNVDWSKTTAYAVGLNGLYVNVKGREKFGIVEPGEEYEKIIAQLSEDLLTVVDPKTGKKPVSLVTHPPKDFHGDYKNQGPDLIVGYSEGYRVSWDSPLGKFPKDIFIDNDEAWSGDHCIDKRVVPGVLITNQQITMEFPALYDLTVAILDEFGVLPLPEMIGKDCLGPPTQKMPMALRSK